MLTADVYAKAPAIVVMGVSASGKSSVAAGLSTSLGIDWLDADDLHPAANVAKMASGRALTDDDRWPWLDRVAEELALGAAAGGVVVACSGLRRAYRDRLRSQAPHAVFVHLTGTPELLEGRAKARTGHFMPATLLASQLASLEPLAADETGVEIDIAAPVPSIVEKARWWMELHGE
jgi:gluconokinase